MKKITSCKPTFNIKENIRSTDKYEPLIYSILHKLIQKKKYSSIIVYFIGGITYEEAKIIYELSQLYKINIITGSTHMLNQQTFIKQLQQKTTF